ncbi:MAG TPA: hypothetical protein VHQ47_08640 [Phycisphaerae bacterium]|nr:hypothetical protein [Phycisphaerae bacterium]
MLPAMFTYLPLHQPLPIDIALLPPRLQPFATSDPAAARTLLSARLAPLQSTWLAPLAAVLQQATPQALALPANLPPRDAAANAILHLVRTAPPEIASRQIWSHTDYYLRQPLSLTEAREHLQRLALPPDEDLLLFLHHFNGLLDSELSYFQPVQNWQPFADLVARHQSPKADRKFAEQLPNILSQFEHGAMAKTPPDNQESLRAMFNDLRQQFETLEPFRLPQASQNLLPLYTSSSGDTALLDSSLHVHWHVGAENLLRPTTLTFRNFLFHYAVFQHTFRPFDSYASADFLANPR